MHTKLRASRPICAPAPRLCSSARRCVGINAATRSQQLQQVLDAIDAANALDPRTVIWNGRDTPYELAYSSWVSSWVQQLEPSPSEECLIVARGQHVQRWKLPRSSHPMNRQGYLQWRESLKQMHASTVTGFMEAAGYPPASMEKVRRFILKRDMKKDPENQVVEDALCLVFLQHQFSDLLSKEGPDKMVDIVRKTWTKMGERGQAAALQLAPQLPEEQRSVVERALA